MLVKKFEAENMTAALQLVKDTLGSDALILSTRTLSRKGLGVLGKQLIEVTAAIESPAMKNNLRKATVSNDVIPEPVRAAFGKFSTSHNQRVETLEDEVVSISRQAAGRSQKVEVRENPLEAEVRQLKAQLEAQNIGQLQAEINELKALMKQLTAFNPVVAPATPAPQPEPQIEAPVVRPEELAIAPPEDIKPVIKRVEPRPAPVSRFKSNLDQQLDDLSAMLVDRGIDAEAATTIARFAEPQMNSSQRHNPDACRRFLARTVAGLVQTSGRLWQQGQPQKRVALLGATGVGKTTTIAKLAAEAITESGARVALVTIDTYRIAAVEQLKIYGEIMGVPVDVVLSPEQLQEAFRRHADKDLILIDTAGRSPQDSLRIDELNQFLGVDAGVENCLVLPATTEERLLQKTYEAFRKLPLSRLIFTKLDETDRCGALINIPTRNNLPLAYLTNGQKVPEDLLLAEPQNVADLVMGAAEETRRMAV